MKIKLNIALYQKICRHFPVLRDVSMFKDKYLAIDQNHFPLKQVDKEVGNNALLCAGMSSGPS